MLELDLIEFGIVVFVDDVDIVDIDYLVDVIEIIWVFDDVFVLIDVVGNMVVISDVFVVVLKD